MTDYVILRHDENAAPGVWNEFGKAKASSPGRALRLLNVTDGTYVAVPARSWKYLTVEVKQTTKVTIF